MLDARQTRFAMAAVLAASAALAALPASATCGDKGGPGYRRPDGKCASWAELKSSCGVPPTTRCHAENVQTRDEREAEQAPK